MLLPSGLVRRWTDPAVLLCPHAAISTLLIADLQEEGSWVWSLTTMPVVSDGAMLCCRTR